MAGVRRSCEADLAASSSSASCGDKRAASFAPPAGSIELHDLPEKATNTAALDTGPDDGPQSEEQETCADLPLNQSMSRAPLLVRSSPAQGTGSYGGLPILSLSSSPDDDDDHVTSPRVSRSRRKGKSKLRQSEPAASQSRTSLNHYQEESAQSEPIVAKSQTRRRSTRDGSSRAFDNASEGQGESGLEARFNASSTVPVAAGAPRIFESLHSSSSSSQIDIPDDGGISDSDELHDLKADDHPSDNSPYAQVRASVAATDDVTLSINTPRMWTLSILFAILGSSTNLFFSLRYPSVSITPIIALLLVHPLGLLWDQILKRSSDPEETFVNGYIDRDNGAVVHASNGNGVQSRPMYTPQGFLLKGSWKQRFRLWLAQGRWNQKEHCCVYISSNVSFGFAFATDVSRLCTDPKWHHR